MFMVLMVERLTPTAARLMLMASMAARPIIIMIRILPTLMEPMAAKLIPMMERERHMEHMAAQLRGVMGVAPRIALMAVLLPGAMVPVTPKVREVVQLVGVTVPELQHQRAEEPEVGADKRVME